VAIGVARGGVGGPRPPKGSGKNGNGKKWKKICTTVLAVQRTNIYLKVFCLVIVNVNVTKYVSQKCQIRQICGYQVCFFKL